MEGKSLGIVEQSETYDFVFSFHEPVYVRIMRTQTNTGESTSKYTYNILQINNKEETMTKELQDYLSKSILCACDQDLVKFTRTSS
jgi:hypothetical protein